MREPVSATEAKYGHRVDWQQRAACRKVSDPDIFFLEKDDPEMGEKIEAAKFMCASCPVFDECRKDIDMQELRLPKAGRVEDEGGRVGGVWEAGIWAGETVVERRARRRVEERDLRLGQQRFVALNR